MHVRDKIVLSLSLSFFVSHRLHHLQHGQIGKISLVPAHGLLEIRKSVECFDVFAVLVQILVLNQVSFHSYRIRGTSFGTQREYSLVVRILYEEAQLTIGSYEVRRTLKHRVSYHDKPLKRVDKFIVTLVSFLHVRKIQRLYEVIHHTRDAIN